MTGWLMGLYSLGPYLCACGVKSTMCSTQNACPDTTAPVGRGLKNLNIEVCTAHLVFGFYCIHRRYRWILWFSVRYAAAVHREILGINALRGNPHQLG